MNARATRRRMLDQVTRAIAGLQGLGLTFDESIKIIERALREQDKKKAKK